MTLRVLVADDQSMFRRGVRLLLDDEPDIEVVAECSDGSQAVAAALQLQPDVAVLDIRMPILDGIAATARMVAAELPTRVVILTTFDLDEFVFAALRAGASGFLLKDAPVERLVEGVRVVAAGDGLLAPAAARRVISQFAALPAHRPDLAAAIDRLTPREVDVLRLLARGHSNPEVATNLYISAATVKTHVAHLLAKLELRDRIQAVIFAYESGLVHAGQPPSM